MMDIFDDIKDLIFGNKRLEALQYFARSKNFSFERKRKLYAFPEEISITSFLKSPKKSAIKGVLSKKEKKYNTQSLIYDYIYRGDFGTKTTTVFHFYSPDFDLPYFRISPKSSISKLGNIFMANDWKDRNVKFGKEYNVESEDYNEMLMMITIQFADLVVELDGFTVEGKGDHLFISKYNHEIDIVDMDNIYAIGLDLVDNILFDQSNQIV